MNIDKVLKNDLIVGIVLGAVVGLHYPLVAYKTPLLVILAVMAVLKFKLLSFK